MIVETGVRAALEEVWQKGEKDGKEHAVLIRNGEVFWRGDGDDKHVSLEELDMHVGDLLVHNHPKSLNSLSDGDIAQAFNYGLGGVYAITADKSVYRARANDASFDIEDFSTGSMLAGFLFDITGKVLVGEKELRAQGLGINFEGDTDGRINESHWTNRMMADKGLIYYDYELAEETSKLVAKIDKELDFPF